MFRALLCVALGCDVNPGGIKGFGPKTIHDIVKNIPQSHTVPHAERIDHFLKAIVSYKGKKSAATINKQALVTFAKALIYETCNVEGDDRATRIYLYDKPTELEEYLDEFAPSDGSVSIVSGPKMVECHGFGHGTHFFLEAEGVVNCATCDAQLCRFCYDRNGKGDILCLGCICGEIVGIVDDLTESEMRAKLDKCQIATPAVATYREVVDLYEIHVNQQNSNFLDGPNAHVKYPTAPSSFFDNANPEVQALITVSTSGLCRVVQDESISIANVCHFMTLISTLIVRERKKKKCDVHSVMPDTFVMFAKNSRVHNGYRLLEVLSAMPQTPASQILWKRLPLLVYTMVPYSWISVGKCGHL